MSGTPEETDAVADSADEDGESEGDNAEDERLLFGERRDRTTLFAGNGLGVTRIEVAAAQVGQFSLVERCTVRCLAADDGLLVVATDEDVYATGGERFVGTGFGPAAAVGIDGDAVYAAGDGRVGRADRETVAAARSDPSDGGESAAVDWETVGEAAGPRRFDGDVLAADSGVFRVGDGTENLGLSGVRDVAGSGSLAATDDGLYRRDGDGWERVIDGDAAAVVETGDAADAVVDGAVFERGGGSGGEWSRVAVPGDSPAVDVAYGRELAVITEEGTVHVEADPARTHDGHGGWRSQALGLRDVTGFVALA